MIYEYIDVNWCLNPILRFNSTPPSMLPWNSALITRLETKLSPLMAPPVTGAILGAEALSEWLSSTSLTSSFPRFHSYEHQHKISIIVRGRWIVQTTYLDLKSNGRGTTLKHTLIQIRMPHTFSPLSLALVSPGSDLLTLTLNPAKGRLRSRGGVNT